MPDLAAKVTLRNVHSVALCHVDNDRIVHVGILLNHAKTDVAIQQEADF